MIPSWATIFVLYLEATTRTWYMAPEGGAEYPGVHGTDASHGNIIRFKILRVPGTREPALAAPDSGLLKSCSAATALWRNSSFVWMVRM